MELSKIIFLVVLILIMVLFAFISSKLYKRQLEKVATERERELLARSSSYQVAFLLMVVYFFGNWIFPLATGKQWGDIYTVCLTGFLLTVIIFVIAAVKRQAYDMLKELRNATAFFIALAIVGVINIGMVVISALNVSNYLLVYEGTVTYLAYNLEIGIALLFLAIVIKAIVGPKEKEVLTEEEQKELEEQYGNFWGVLGKKHREKQAAKADEDK